MKKNSLEQTVSEMKKYIQRDVAAGFSGLEVIIDTAVDVFSDEQDKSLLRPYAEKITIESMAAHLQEQADWDEVTDCDRLDKAFEELESKGIVSRQNYSCCGNCGTGEILDEAEAIQSREQKVRGYTFYHIQDTEHAVDGHGLYLNYGSIEHGKEANVNIGHEIVKVINQHNLITDWDGDLRVRIFVKLDWKRRR